MIKCIQGLKEFFVRGGVSVYVSTKIRKEWMLNDESVIVNGEVKQVDFINKLGGVWLASI